MVCQRQTSSPVSLSYALMKPRMPYSAPEIGHSDATGDPASNRQLSERRAEQVKEILVNYYEISADRLSTEGLGNTVPIASNATPEGRRANRRVEVLILN